MKELTNRPKLAAFIVMIALAIAAFAAYPPGLASAEAQGEPETTVGPGQFAAPASPPGFKDDAHSCGNERKVSAGAPDARTQGRTECPHPVSEVTPVALEDAPAISTFDDDLECCEDVVATVQQPRTEEMVEGEEPGGGPLASADVDSGYKRGTDSCARQSCESKECDLGHPCAHGRHDGAIAQSPDTRDPGPPAFVELPAQALPPVVDVPDTGVLPSEPVDLPDTDVLPTDPVDLPDTDILPSEPVDLPDTDVLPGEPVDSPGTAVAPTEPVDLPDADVLPAEPVEVPGAIDGTEDAPADPVAAAGGTDAATEAAPPAGSDPAIAGAVPASPSADPRAGSDEVAPPGRAGSHELRSNDVDDALTGSGTPERGSRPGIAAPVNGDGLFTPSALRDSLLAIIAGLAGVAAAWFWLRRQQSADGLLVAFSGAPADGEADHQRGSEYMNARTRRLRRERYEEAHRNGWHEGKKVHLCPLCYEDREGPRREKDRPTEGTAPSGAAIAVGERVWPVAQAITSTGARNGNGLRGGVPWAEAAAYRVEAIPSASRPTTHARVSVVIPAKNEEKSLPRVLASLPPWLHEVILVDGVSEDATSEVARRLLPAIRIVSQKGRGKGSALREGFERCTGDIVIALDADGSMDPHEIGRFVAFLESGFDYVKGSRVLTGGSSTDLTSFRRFGNLMFRTLTNFIHGSRYSDLCYGYFGFRRGTIDALDLRANGFEIETEISIKAHQAGLRTAEIPSHESSRSNGSSNLNAFRDGFRILFTIVRTRLSWKVQPPAHLGVLAALGLGIGALLMLGGPDGPGRADSAAGLLSSGTVTLNPVDDAYVEAGSPGTNFGSETVLLSDASPLRESFLKFDLLGLTGQSVSQATLRTYVTSRSLGEQNLKEVADNTWTEAAITFDDKPDKGPVIISFTPSTAGVWWEVDVTAAVAGKAGSLMSVALDSASSDGFDFNSSEAATNPVELVVQFADSPTPTASPTATAPEATPTPTLTLPLPTPTLTATPEATPTPTLTLRPLTPTPTSTAAEPTATPSPTPTPESPTPTPTSTSPPSGTLTLNPVDDAYVEGRLPGTNFGSETELLSDASPPRESFLKFDLGPLAGVDVSQATLRMFVTSRSRGEQNLKEVGDNAWSETTITFGNKPGKGPVITSFTPSTPRVWMEVDVTSAVDGRAGSLMSMALDSASSDGFDFNSEEAARDRVELVIHYGGSPITTPTQTPTPTATPTATPTSAGTPTPTPTATATPTSAPTPNPNGFKGPSYSPATAPTGEKPQSKLWFNDGIWWGSLFSTATDDFHIHRLNWSSQTWVDTGTLIDPRVKADVDVLWDGTKLYAVSVVPNSTAFEDRAQLRRYSYNASTDTYTLDSDFPVTVVSSAAMETIVMAKDTTGKLWVTYTRNNAVWVARTTIDDSTWGTPFTPPVNNVANLTPDDISAMVAFDSKIGVLWGNQNTETYYFATHLDGAGDMTWQSGPALAIPEGADDHINVKALSGDPSGRVFAAVKTSLNSSNDPLIMLLVLKPDGTWTNHTFGTASNNHTRPIVTIDQENRKVYMFAAAPCCSGGTVYYKEANLDAISFPTGLGSTFMKSSSDNCINNVSSTKQNLTGSTDLVVIAGADCTRFYFHNNINLPP